MVLEMLVIININKEVDLSEWVDFLPQEPIIGDGVEIVVLLSIFILSKVVFYRKMIDAPPSIWTL